MRQFHPRLPNKTDRVRFCLSMSAALAALLLSGAGCGTEPPADWQWWTSSDSAAVGTALAGWRPALNGHRALGDTLRLNLRVGLTAADSTSLTGATLYKFARLVNVWVPEVDTAHVDELHFGVTVDTMALHPESANGTMGDTFCQVGYYDKRLVVQGAETLASIVKFSYDSLWAVSFRPETTVSGPDTTVIWRVSSTELLGFPAPQETTKSLSWSARRVAFVHKVDSTPDYRLTKITGFAAFVPSTQDAPSIDRVILSRPGQIDTFFYSPRADGRGLYNLRRVDSLYVVQAGEQVNVVVTTSTPADTGADRNRFFIGVGQTRTDVTVGAKRGEATVAFADTGYQHIYIEVIPISSLYYRDREHKSTVWALPVHVESQP